MVGVIDSSERVIECGVEGWSIESETEWSERVDRPSSPNVGLL